MRKRRLAPRGYFGRRPAGMGRSYSFNGPVSAPRAPLSSEDGARTRQPGPVTAPRARCFLTEDGRSGMRRAKGPPGRFRGARARSPRPWGRLVSGRQFFARGSLKLIDCRVDGSPLRLEVLPGLPEFVGALDRWRGDRTHVREVPSG